MERDFKQEFIELKQNEIPDLWNRIEAGLSEKKVTASAPERSNSSFKKINWRRWGTLAAACLCVVIIVPAISMIIRNSDGGNYTTGITNDTAYSGSSTAAADEGTLSEAPALDGDGSEGAYTADAGSMYSEDKGTADMASDWDNSVTGAQDSMEMTQANNESATPSEAENTSETARADEEARVENSVDIKDLGLKNGQTIENVLVQIVEAEAAGEEVIYQAVVIEPDADANLKKNMQIEIVCVSDTEYDSLSMAEKEMLKDGESYGVSLRFEQDKIIVTNVKKAY